MSKKEIATLGDSEVFIKRNGTGGIKSVQGKLTLKEEAGHLAYIYPKMTITAQGYYYLNKIAGLNIIDPSSLTLPSGEKVINPYVVTDKKGRITQVWVKKIAIGYSPIGNLTMTSSTLLYDLKTYLIQDLLNTVKDKPLAGRICVESSLTEDERKKGVFYDIDEMFGVYVNLSDPDILKNVSTYVQNSRFAERKAQTICERNALKKHPALSMGNSLICEGAKDHKIAKVSVIGFSHDLTSDELKKLEKMAEKGEIEQIGNNFDEINDEDIIIDKEDEETTIEEPKENKNIDNDISEAEIVEEKEEEKMKLITEIIESVAIIGQENYDHIHNELGGNELNSYTTDDLKLFKKMIQEEEEKKMNEISGGDAF